jgi:outer membrane immunogenic protein
MKKFLLGSIALIALNSADSALAADMSVKAPVYKAPMVVSSYSWTGLYIGVNAGGAWGKSDITTFLTGIFGVNTTAVGIADSPSLKPNGFTGGVQGGYNYQIGNIVLGIELDLNYLGLKDSLSGTFPYPGLGGGTFTVSNSVQTDWLFTARTRIGYAFDRALIYATGGLAVTNVRYNESFNDVFATSENSSISANKTGWTAGGGLEYAMTNNWSAKAEYLYANFGSVNSAVHAINAPVTFHHEARLTTNIVRAGLNYKFDWGPVVAKY